MGTIQQRQDFDIVVSTAPGLNDPAVAIAAVRGGATGVLDLEYARCVKSASAAITSLARNAEGPCGIKLDAEQDELCGGLIEELPKQIRFVVLTPAGRERLLPLIATLHDRGLKVWLEATNLEHALLAEKLEADGLVAKGNEAAGSVGEQTSFVLLQHIQSRVSLPVWVQGGIGIHTAAACYVAGARGVMLDDQVALTRESSLPAKVKASIASMDGSETVCLGSEIGRQFRIYTRPGFAAVNDLQNVLSSLAGRTGGTADEWSAWRRAVRERVGWESSDRAWLLGQSAAFASPLARQFRTVGGVVEGIREAVDEHVSSARLLRPLDEEAALARSHGTRYPIVQGPMTRVSDRAAFAAGLQ